MVTAVKSTSAGVVTLMEYEGNEVIENGKLRMLLFDGGYVDFSSEKPRYCWYTKDHLGSVRSVAVADADGNVFATYAYSPYGEDFAAMTPIAPGTTNSTSQNSQSAPVSHGGGHLKDNEPLYPTVTYSPAEGPDWQPFKFGGKESLTRVGLDLYDFGARMYFPSAMRWMTMDPLCEKYYHISPYAYCAGNPVNLVDPEGMWFWGQDGNLYWSAGDSAVSLADYLQINLSDAISILDRNANGESIHFFDGFYINSHHLWVEPRPQFGVTINNTLEAVIHYYAKNGIPANIGNESVEEAIAIINEPHPNILQESAGRGGINMTKYTFHIGKTPFAFEVKNNKNSILITYHLFMGDSFSDPLYFLENANASIEYFNPDHLGSNLEFGGRPYEYNTKTRTYFKPGIFPRLH